MAERDYSKTDKQIASFVKKTGGATKITTWANHPSSKRVVTFGTYKGCAVADVSRSYLLWLFNVFISDAKKKHQDGVDICERLAKKGKTKRDDEKNKDFLAMMITLRLLALSKVKGPRNYIRSGVTDKHYDQLVDANSNFAKYFPSIDCVIQQQLEEGGGAPIAISKDLTPIEEAMCLVVEKNPLRDKYEKYNGTIRAKKKRSTPF